jgi:predicted SprT family Zn-dependent metalloprotease
MEPSTAKQLADDLIAEYPDLMGWTVRFSSRARRRLGLCNYTRKVIQLSSAFIELNGEDLVAETVKHEIAHALTPGHGHDEIWKRMAVLVGAPHIRCANIAVRPPGRWVAVCPTCERVFFMYRRPKPRKRWCLRCGRFDGILNFR